jgi:hypothetical protein
MKVDITFSIAKVYNVEDVIDVEVGQLFRMETDYTEPLLWFTFNDPVLSLIQNEDGSAVAESKQIGKSIILLMTPSFQLLKKLTVTCLNEIGNPAVTLGLTAENPVQK